MTVAELLEQSHAAHQRYRDALLSPVKAIKPALMDAQAARLDAHAQDPTHQDQAWQDEQPRYDHDALLAFYAEQLAR